MNTEEQQDLQEAWDALQHVSSYTERFYDGLASFDEEQDLADNEQAWVLAYQTVVTFSA